MSYQLTIYLVAITIWLGQCSPAGANNRIWSNKDGRTLEGELIGVEESRVLVRRVPDRRVLRLPLTALAAADRKYLDELMKSSKHANSEFIVLLPPKIESSIKAYYTFYGKDQLGIDSSGNRAPLATAKTGWDKNGVVGGAAAFNGKTSIFAMQNPVSLRNQPLTVSLWIKTSCKEEQEVFVYGARASGLAVFTQNRSVGFAYRWKKGPNLLEIKRSSYQVTAGRWHHVCGVVSENGNVTLWVDGEKSGPQSGELIADNPTAGAVLGTVLKWDNNVRETRTSRPFNGLIDEFMIFDRALQDLEVTELYDRYKPFVKE